MSGRRLLQAGAAAGIALIAVVPAMRLWDADLRVPFSYSKDGVFQSMTVKAVIEQGWFQSIDRLGAPESLELHDYPVGGNTLDYLLIKGMGVVTHDYALVENLFYLLTFALVALSAFLVLRAIGASALFGGVAAVLYALAPYHFARGENHLMLSSYYCVPLACWLALLLLQGDPLVFTGDTATRRFDRRRALGVAAACAVIGSSSGSGYYAVFAALLFVIAGGLSFLRHRDSRVIVSGVEAAALVIVVLLVNLSPSMLYRLRNGENPDVNFRGAAESENFGLKMAHMVLPVEGHRLESLASLRARYAQFPPRNETSFSALGATATVGFGWLLVVVFGLVGGAGWASTRRHRELAALNLALVMLATVGGGAVLIALVVSTQIRAWNRVSIFIAFFSMTAVALLLDRLRERRRLGRGALVAIAGALVIVGVADQASPAYVPRYEEMRAQFASDRRFVRGIERSLPRGASIFQLPYVPFPEPPAIFGSEGDYDHMKGFLHSRHLRWSGSAMQGRPADWPAAIATKPLELALPSVAAAGFSGVWINRGIYGPAADTVQRGVEAVAGVAGVRSRDRKFAFVDLRPLAATQRETLGAERLEVVKDAVLHPVTVRYGDGFGRPESDLTDVWRWADKVATLELHNPKGTPQPAIVTFPVSAGQAGQFHLEVKPPGAPRERHVIAQERSTVRVRMVVPPGTSSIRLSTDVPPLPLAPSQVVNAGRIRVYPVDVTIEAMTEALAAA